jgi:hypothetical protein
MNLSVTRKAILIGCPGTRSNYLHGVEKDLLSVKSFLTSDKGGRWFDNEIITLKNPTFSQVKSLVRSAIADYVFIYFSGHGWTSNQNKRMVSFRDKCESDLSLLNESPRQLIIIDACRNYVAPGIHGIPDFGEQWDSFDGYYESREIFDKHILSSPPGRIIIHATQIGEYSYDNPRTGGYFTQALLKSATKTTSVRTYSIVSINETLEAVPDILKQQNNNQIPSILKSGNLTVPFAIRVPNENLVNYPQANNKQSRNSSNVSQSGIVAVFSISLLLIAILASGNSK